MKNTIIAVLVITNIATIIFAHRTVEAIRVDNAATLANHITKLDNFYYGFCQDAKDHGYDKLDSWDRLCGQ